MSKSTLFSVTTEHALRAMVHLARTPAGEPVLGRDLADQTSIPGNYLSKMLVTLRNAGLVQTTRGQHGGYRIAKAPSEIRLIDIADLFEGSGCAPGCLLGENHECCDELACPAHTRWKQVVDVYAEFLRTTTIADIRGGQDPGGG
ncbi:MAG: Rrf2 family transcriptional regulator [Pirellulaceae bacterium]